MKLSALSGHIKAHITSQKRPLSEGAADPAAKRQRKAWVIPAKTMPLTWEMTMVSKDDKNPEIEHAAGTPLSAALVLRNIARNVVKTESEEHLLKEHEKGGEGGGWNEKLFRPVMARLFEVMTENKHLVSFGVLFNHHSIPPPLSPSLPRDQSVVANAYCRPITSRRCYSLCKPTVHKSIIAFRSCARTPPEAATRPGLYFLGPVLFNNSVPLFYTHGFGFAHFFFPPIPS